MARSRSSRTAGQVYVVGGLRSPFAAAHGGLASWHPAALAGKVLAAALPEGAAPDSVDALLVGCAEPVGAQGANVAQAARTSAGWPDVVPATTLQRGATGGLDALVQGAFAVRAGSAALVVAAGVEVTSVVPAGATAMARMAYGRPWGPAVERAAAVHGGLLPDPVAIDRGVAAAIGRARADAWALESRVRAAAAHERRALIVLGELGVDELAPVVAADELAALPPLFDPSGVVTAATWAPAGDGAAVVVLASAAAVEALGLTPWCALGPTCQRGGRLGGVTPAAAHDALLAVVAGAELAPSDLARVDHDEAAAAAALGLCDAGQLDPGVLNPDGGSLALGHPGAATGVRLALEAAAALRSGRAEGPAAVVAEGADGATALVLSPVR